MNMRAGDPPVYRGRFAPSPTGPLHFGSLVAAVGSFLQARSRAGEWLLRIEDIDPPREVAGAADSILRTLEAYGLYWDGPVLYQGRRGKHYAQALEVLAASGSSYPCGCSRREISKTAGPKVRAYPGTCRQGLAPGKSPRSIRVRTTSAVIEFLDAVQGRVVQDLEMEVGDFVVRRADRLIAYQLAVVVDDAAQGITEVVRGSDLLASTPRQIHLQRLLGLPAVAYAHLPVAVNRQGKKLSKHNHAPPVGDDDPVPVLYRVLDLLGLKPAPALLEADLDSFWNWAVDRWRLENVPGEMELAGGPRGR